jgi:hypothetical protein
VTLLLNDDFNTPGDGGDVAVLGVGLTITQGVFACF